MAWVILSLLICCSCLSWTIDVDGPKGASNACNGTDVAGNAVTGQRVNGSFQLPQPHPPPNPNQARNQQSTLSLPQPPPQPPPMGHFDGPYPPLHQQQQPPLNSFEAQGDLSQPQSEVSAAPYSQPRETATLGMFFHDDDSGSGVVNVNDVVKSGGDTVCVCTCVCANRQPFGGGNSPGSGFYLQVTEDAQQGTQGEGDAATTRPPSVPAPVSQQPTPPAAFPLQQQQQQPPTPGTCSAMAMPISDYHQPSNYKLLDFSTPQSLRSNQAIVAILIVTLSPPAPPLSLPELASLAAAAASPLMAGGIGGEAPGSGFYLQVSLHAQQGTQGEGDAASAATSPPSVPALVAQQSVSYGPPGYPLQDLRTHAQCSGDDKWGDWRPHLTIDSSQMVMGYDPSLSSVKSDSSEAIQPVETYEYAQSLGSQPLSLPNFQVIFECRLAESGLCAPAFHYCEAVSLAVQKQTPYHSIECIAQANEISVRFYDPQLKEKPEQELFLKPDWLDRQIEVIFECRLAESGLCAPAFHYCKLISLAVQKQTPYYSIECIAQANEISVRFYDPQLKEKPEQELFLKPDWLDRQIEEKPEQELFLKPWLMDQRQLDRQIEFLSVFPFRQVALSSLETSVVVWDEKNHPLVNQDEPEEESKPLPPTHSSVHKMAPPGAGTESGVSRRYVDIPNRGTGPGGVGEGAPKKTMPAPADLFAPLAPMPMLPANILFSPNATPPTILWDGAPPMPPMPDAMGGFYLTVPAPTVPTFLPTYQVDGSAPMAMPPLSMQHTGPPTPQLNSEMPGYMTPQLPGQMPCPPMPGQQMPGQQMPGQMPPPMQVPQQMPGQMAGQMPGQMPGGHMPPPQVFDCVIYLCKHRSTHTGEKLYQCSLCGEKFAYNQSLQDHQAMVISGENSVYLWSKRSRNNSRVRWATTIFRPLEGDQRKPSAASHALLFSVQGLASTREPPLLRFRFANSP
ncbi:uncharacterized protein LOC134458708 [Engraulis encrasicolus]|uniref:uncharacterized protein LOC134458708 n=1 Tax=Engraulis encrasicolus TaxID=184585 RepID=UPI002FD118C0